MVKITVSTGRTRALVLDFPGRDASSVTVGEVKAAVHKQIAKVGASEGEDALERESGVASGGTVGVHDELYA